MPSGLLRIEWCLIFITIISTLGCHSHYLHYHNYLNLIFLISIPIIYIITICLFVILRLVFMIATFGSCWLINYPKVIKAVDSFTLIIMLTLPDYQGVSQTQNETHQLIIENGSSILQDQWGFGSVPHRNNIWTPNFPYPMLLQLS